MSVLPLPLCDCLLLWCVFVHFFPGVVDSAGMMTGGLQCRWRMGRIRFECGEDEEAELQESWMG